MFGDGEALSVTKVYRLVVVVDQNANINAPSSLTEASAAEKRTTGK